MSKGDEIVDRGAAKLDDAAARAARSRGPASRLASELADDAAFLRKLKPSLIVARARGRLPKDGEPGRSAASTPSGDQLGPRPSGGKGGGPNPLAVVGAAAAAGALLAKAIDWRGHAHPRR